jgi:hypothetical protein
VQFVENQQTFRGTLRFYFQDGKISQARKLSEDGGDMFFWNAG